MILRNLQIKNLKLLRDFELSFLDEQGQPRMWTVIIGENGTAKTALLQAIALAAAGSLQVNSLARRVISQLRDRRHDEQMEVVATFGFQDPPQLAKVPFPGLTSSAEPASQIRVRSRVTLAADSTTLRAHSEYEPRLWGSRIRSFRTDEDDHKLEELRAALRAADVDPEFEPVPRTP